METKITSKRIEQNTLIIECNDGEVELSIPIKGNIIDIIRTKIKINVSNKYTANDIHIIQEKIFSELNVVATNEEIEK